MRFSGGVLDPVERISEVLFGLIMALTITGTVSVVSADQLQIRTMLIAALGCNLAWGIIDAGMYLLARLGERGRYAVVAQAVRRTEDTESAHRMIANELPPLLASTFEAGQLQFVRQTINQMPVSEVSAMLTKRDWFGALGVCLLVILSTFPVVIPFIVIEDVKLALRVSNVLAVISLFLCGFFFARYAGLRPWATGLALAAISAVMVAIAIALGG